MARSITTHPEKSCAFTEHAREICQWTNTYRRNWPKATFARMGEEFRHWARANQLRGLYHLSNESLRRYYYGVHAVNTGGWRWPGSSSGSYNQVRLGAAVEIN